MAVSDWMTPSERRLALLLFLLAALGTVVRTGEHLSPGVTRWLETGGGIADADSARPGEGRAEPPPATGADTVESGPVPAETVGGPAQGGIDPNTAPASVLIGLPGIGPALAGRIVADREARGPFRTPEDLLRVRGVGPATLERIRDRLRFPGPSPAPSGGS